MSEWVEEIIVLLFVMVSVPAFVYALEKLKQKRIISQWLIVLIYFLIFLVFLELIEKRIP
jgi:hypothetical protein